LNFFDGKLQRVSNHIVATIRGKGHPASGIGTVKWRWTNNDAGKSHDHLIRVVLYFLQSPINIISDTTFARQLEDIEGTDIDTKMLFSCFYWDFGKCGNIIKHPASNLPEMHINEGICLFTQF